MTTIFQLYLSAYSDYINHNLSQVSAIDPRRNIVADECDTSSSGEEPNPEKKSEEVGQNPLDPKSFCLNKDGKLSELSVRADDLDPADNEQKHEASSESERCLGQRFRS